ncbi:MAG: HD domain-containing protein [Bacteroidota bacterium]
MTTFTGGGMGILSFNHLLFYAFLLFTALVGTYKTKVKNFQEYAVGNGRFGVGAFILTLWATIIGGGMVFGVPKDVYTSGIAGIIAHEFQIIAPILLVLYLIAPKIVHFKNCLTIGELMALFYGEPARILTGLLSVVYCVCVCAYQFMFLKFMGDHLGITSLGGLAFGVFLLAFYTVRGGMRGVVATDMLHFVVAFGVLPLVVHLMLYQAGGAHALFEALPLEKWQFFSPDALKMGKRTDTITASIVAGLFPSFALSFPFIQRMLMTKHQEQARSMYRGVLVLCSVFIVLLGFIGLAGSSLSLPAPHSVLLSLLEQIPLSRGVVFIAILGLVVSTADSFLHATGLAFVHDTLQPLAKRWSIQLDELSAIRYFTILIAFLGFFLCLCCEKVPTVFFYAFRFSSVLIVFPLMAGIMGLKTDKRVFYASMVLTVFAYGLPWLLLPINRANDLSNVGSIVTSLFSYLGAHYYYHGGFVTVPLSVYGQTTTIWHPAWASSSPGTKITLSHLFPLPHKVWHYFQQKAAENTTRTTTLALFVSCSYMVPLFMHTLGQPAHYHQFLTLRVIGALLCVGLLLQSQWPTWLLRFFPAYYHVTLLFCFPLMTTFLFLLEGGSIEWVLNVMFSITVFILLLDYVLGILLGGLGIGLAWLLYKQMIGPVVLSMDRETVYLLFYGAGFSMLIGMLFSRIREQWLRQSNRRMEHQAAVYEAKLPQLLAEKQTFMRAIEQTRAEGLLGITRKLHALTATVQQLQGRPAAHPSLVEQQASLQAELQSKQQELQAELLPIALQLQDLKTRGHDYLRLHLEEDLPLDEFLLSLQERLLPRGIDVPLLIERKTSVQKLTVDADQLGALIVKGIASLQWQLKDLDDYLLLGLEDTYLRYPLPDLGAGYVKQVAALRLTLTSTQALPMLSGSYAPDLTIGLPHAAEHFKALEEQEDSRLLKAHYGYMEISAHTLVYVVPVDVKAVRPSHLDATDKALDGLPEESPAPSNASALTKSFLAAVEAHSALNVEQVKLGLNVLTWCNKHHPAAIEEAMSVGEIVLGYAPEAGAVMGALLYRLVEETPLVLDHISLLFGREIADVVKAVTHVQSVAGSMYKIKLSEEEQLLLLERAENKSGQYVKLGSRLHALRTMDASLQGETKDLIARETLRLFVPLASKLGLQSVAEELTERCQSMLLEL